MSNSAINTQVAQLKIGNVQNQADNSAVYSGGVWSLKNSTALTSVTITDAGLFGVGTSSFSGTTRVAFNNPNAAEMKILASVSAGTFACYQVFVNSTVTTIGTENSVGGTLAAGTSAYSTVLANNGAYPISFATNNTERMRIDAVGALTVGSSGSTISHTIQAPSNPAGTAAVHVRKQSVAINSSGNSYVEFYGSSGGFDGYLGISGTTLQVIDASDSRKKENVRPANYGLNEIKALNPVVYDWKEEFGGEKDIKGFLAQEVKQILPECVTIQDESERGGFSDSHFLGTANMIPVLVAAIQELSAKNDALEARLAALEAK